MYAAALIHSCTRHRRTGSLDPDRFDALSRALITRGFRRDAVRAVFGTLLGTALLGLSSESLAAVDKKKSRLPASNELGANEVSTAGHGCRHAGVECARSDQCCSGKCLRNNTCSCNTNTPCRQPPNPCKKAICRSTGKCVIRNRADGPTMTCGTGACERSVPQCLNGQEQTCVPGEPSGELCNGIDDDCDGVVDNGYNFDTDVNNCGGCNTRCAPCETCQDRNCVLVCTEPNTVCCSPGPGTVQDSICCGTGFTCCEDPTPPEGTTRSVQCCPPTWICDTATGSCTCPAGQEPCNGSCVAMCLPTQKRTASCECG